MSTQTWNIILLNHQFLSVLLFLSPFTPLPSQPLASDQIQSSPLPPSLERRLSRALWSLVLDNSVWIDDSNEVVMELLMRLRDWNKLLLFWESALLKLQERLARQNRWEYSSCSRHAEGGAVFPFYRLCCSCYNWRLNLPYNLHNLRRHHRCVEHSWKLNSYTCMYIFSYL